MDHDGVLSKVPHLAEHLDAYCSKALRQHHEALLAKFSALEVEMVELRKNAVRLNKAEVELRDTKTRLNWAEPRWIYHQARTWVLTAMVVGMVLMLLLFFSPFGAFIGFAAGTTVGGAEAETARGVHEATRNLIAILGPILIGITIWVITVVAERRLKAYDQTIEDFRTAITEAATEMRREFDGLRDKTDRMRERTEDRGGKLFELLDRAGVTHEKTGTAMISQQVAEFRAALAEKSETFALQTNEKLSALEQIQRDLEDRFGFLVGQVTWRADAAMSAGVAHERAQELFASRKANEAVVLTLELFAKAMPFRKVRS